MFDKLAFIEEKYEDLSKKISDPQIIADNETWSKYCKEHSDITPIVEKYREYKAAMETVSDAEEMLKDNNDKEFEEMLRSELSEAQEKIALCEQELKILLLPKDPNDDKNVIIEIRGGAGGDEAALFAADLMRMYSMYAEAKNWKIDIMNTNETDIGGYKEISFMLVGQGAYSRLKFESGVHRVQRVPSTESSGRIHTSTVTVAVLPEVEDVEVEINQNDLRIDVFRAGLYDLISSQQHEEIAQNRKSQVGTGDRSERIRTYNFPQGRVTDHRIGLTLHKLEAVLNGDLDELIDALITADQSEKLKANGGE